MKLFEFEFGIAADNFLATHRTVYTSRLVRKCRQKFGVVTAAVAIHTQRQTNPQPCSPAASLPHAAKHTDKSAAYTKVNKPTKHASRLVTRPAMATMVSE